MWLFYSIQMSAHIDLAFLGIKPLTLKGAIGIFTAPLIHGSASHLASNTFPILFLGAALYLFYDRIASQVFLQCYLFTNILVWFFGRSDFYHIGASGLVYALASFLIFFGIFRRKFRSMIISIVVLLVYGGLIYGILPQNTYISWESHLMGFLVGMGSAFGMSKITKVYS
ncbi:MAG: rhombosortase [Flammeovirgaceae bacterium]|nr:rhombosortase [Flammeovirgaceae bacterium]MBR08245.1 rhombosortase [Rickettsiales bacterium]HCX21349.1 rhombosortase [Cytophagales bacterium]|tara:strand:+ start:1173 stop:1682 length:510 start_codon:yes stop_codon:yes gene_type:complete